MTATLSIINNVQLDSETAGQQGDPADTTLAIDTPLEISVSGTYHRVKGTLATAAGVTVWDEDDDAPSDWDYLFIVSDQDCYLQLIGQTTHVVVNLKADVPFTLYGDQIFTAANTTAISANPTLEDIDSVRLWNASGTTLNYVFAVVD